MWTALAPVENQRKEGIDGSGAGHDGAMTLLMPKHPGADRDDLARHSDARSADVPLPAVPGVADVPPAGRHVVIDDRGLYVRELLGPQDGPTTLYVHGLAGSSTNFSQLAPLLAPHTRGLLVDLPGFARSDPPPGGRYRLDDIADLLAELVRRSVPDQPVHVVGNSLGGMVAVEFAARHPELVRTLTLISPAVPDLRVGGDRGADSRLGLLLAPGTTKPAVRRLAAIDALDRARGLAQLCYGDPSLLTDADVRAAADDIRWRDALPWAQRAVLEALRALMRSYLRVGRRAFRLTASRLRMPTLIIWGTRDRLVSPTLARRTAAAFPQARLLILPGCGHVAQMERPEETARAIIALFEDAGSAGPNTAASGVPRPTGLVAVGTS